MAVVASLLLAACMTAAPPPPAPHVVVRSLVFDTSLARFDGCSVPVLGSTGRTFDFFDACRRHDFAYRNLGRLDDGKWWTPQMRARVDSIFRRDMLANCAGRQPSARATCNAWAETFYRAVRIYAGP